MLLTELFRRELAVESPAGRVFAADLNPALSPACQVADADFRVPPVSDPAYPDLLLRLCKSHDVGLVIPTIDTELQTLAVHRERFAEEGVQVVVSSPEFVRLCRDKRLTNGLFKGLGVDTPRLVSDPTEADLPLLAKPYDGSCSAGLRVLREANELRDPSLNNPRLIYLEYLEHDEHDEYTVDMYFDRSGRLRCMVPRLRIEVRSGEVSKGMTQRSPTLEGVGVRFKELAGARGCLTAQFFVHRKTQRVFGIEINARFGGGYPLAYEAGANYPRWILDEYFYGRSICDYDGWTEKLTMLRYDAHVLVPGAAA